jgi:hypothetical protein
MSDRPAPDLSQQEQATLAQQLLDNPIVDHILVQMDSEATLTWRRSTSAVQREEQWHLVVAIAMFRKMLQSRAENMKHIAERQRRSSKPTV